MKIKDEIRPGQESSAWNFGYESLAECRRNKPLQLTPICEGWHEVTKAPFVPLYFIEKPEAGIR